jgi:chemotaxis protein histidine kinase CheA
MNEDRNIGENEDENINQILDISYQEYIENYYLYNISYIESISNLYNILLENILYSELENDNKKYKKVATEKEINNIEKIKFNEKYAKEHNIPLECPIYYNEFKENETICKLKCGHYFSDKAITKWLTYESNCCPICRYEYDYKKINLDIEINSTQANSTQANSTQANSTQANSTQANSTQANSTQANSTQANSRQANSINLSNFFIENLQNNLFNENIINENRYLFDDSSYIIDIDNIIYEVETVYRNRIIDN